MNPCQHCKHQTQLHLCDDCQTTLTNMLDQLPWLLEELDARIQKLDRINLGTIGRNRRADQLDVMDFDAAEQARETRKKLLDWVEKIAVRHLGRPPAAMQTVSTIDLAKWLSTNIAHIARDSRAGKIYGDIKTLVGEDQRGGQLITAINPTEKHSAGPCPTITGRHRNGTPRQCGHMLFADTYDKTTTCPKCGQDINVEKNRTQAAADRDLHTKASIIEVLTNIGEPITEDQVDRWIQARRLRPLGYVQDGVIIEFRLTEQDEPVYSIDRARKLRRRDQHLRLRRKTPA